MTKVAWVFPGQGSQSVGMCRDLYNDNNTAREIFEQADDVLGIKLSRLCFEGPEDKLTQTINAQPALVTASYACLQVAREIAGKSLPEASFLAGHSLGEYTALAVAGVFDFATAVHLARERGRLMHEAGQLQSGSMAAIIGLEEQLLAEVCKKTDTVMANVNCPGQIVISGAADNIARAMEMATAAGAKRAIELQVSGAFHSPLMKPVVDELIKYLGETEIKDPTIPVIANMTGEPLSTATEVRTELRNQLTNPVQWQRTIEYICRQGVPTFIEIGPGKVLTGLIRRINSDARTINLNDLESIRNLASE